MALQRGLRAFQPDWSKRFANGRETLVRAQYRPPSEAPLGESAIWSFTVICRARGRSIHSTDATVDGGTLRASTWASALVWRRDSSTRRFHGAVQSNSTARVRRVDDVEQRRGRPGSTELVVLDAQPRD